MATESSKPSVTLRELNLKRNSVKGQITRFKNFLSTLESSELNTFELAELSLKLSKFETLASKFDSLQTEIEVLNPQALDSEIDEREAIESDIICCMAKAKVLIEDANIHTDNRRKSIAADSPCRHSHNQSQGSSGFNFKLPKIEIAKFNGDYFRWAQFRDAFLTLVDKNDRISDIHKFHYLVSYLEGDAARIISNFEVSSTNYTSAWSLLCERYDNKRVLINQHLTALFNMQPISRESERSLRFLVDHVTKNLRALSSLGQPTDKWDILLIFMLSSKLDNQTLLKWEELRNTFEDVPTLSQFNKFLTDRADVLEALNRSKQDKFNSGQASAPRPAHNFYKQQTNKGNNFNKQNNYNKDEKQQYTRTFASTSQHNNKKIMCIICKDAHRIYDCSVFKNKNLNDKLSDVEKHNLCQNCLRQNHQASECKLGPCRVCNKKHNTMIHSDSSLPVQSSTSLLSSAEAVNFSKGSSEVILSTAIIEVSNPQTHTSVKVRALLDCGSQSSFITENLKQKLQLNTQRIETIKVVGIGNNSCNNVVESSTIQIQSLNNSYKTSLPCLVLKELTGNLPKAPINIQNIQLPADITLADPNFDLPAKIDVLLGANIFWDVLYPEKQSLGPKNPKLINSKFGWLIAGRIHASTTSYVTQCNHSTNHSYNHTFNQPYSYNHSTSHTPMHASIQSYNHTFNHAYPCNRSNNHAFMHEPIHASTHESNHAPKHVSSHTPKYDSNHAPKHELIHSSNQTNHAPKHTSNNSYNQSSNHSFNLQNNKKQTLMQTCNQSNVDYNTYEDQSFNHTHIQPAIDKILTKFWEIEEVPHKNVLSNEEKMCEEHFLANTSRLSSGRFSVMLPLKINPDCLGDSYNMAKKRLLNLEKRFRNNPDLKSQYTQFIREYAELGHLSVSTDPKPSPGYFLCHHAVFREGSESTKIRVVFDGSAPTSSGHSLNDILMVGPNVQNSLFSILIRARQYKYLLTGDIEKMYRQVEVNPKHRNLQLILWREDDSLPIQTLQLNVLTYGTASAAHLSTRCLWQVGDECKDSQIQSIIKNDFYVDDLITGANSEAELRHIQKAVADALNSACFPLRKYKSNLPNLFNEVDRSSTNDKLILSESTSTLGLGWNPNEDYLHYPIKPITIDNSEITKRSIMSNAFKIFDPLGLLSPCIIQPKMILQTLWSLKLEWDDPVPQDVKKAWNNFSDNTHHLASLKIPRMVSCSQPTAIELHSFSDAAQGAYGACVYVKSTNIDNDVSVRLLCAKSKVSPLKPTTIPRLELCAALLSARLIKGVLEAIRYKPVRVVYWCDSSVVLAWIHSPPRNLKTFVANRVGEIVETTHPSSWRYVPTADNPADLISRGVNASQLLNSKFWWQGPNFLAKDENEWPSLNLNKKQNDLPEVKSIHAIPAVVTEPVIIMENYSNFTKLQRSFAFVRRFIHNSRNPASKRSGILTTDELQESFRHLCVMAQLQSFPADYKMLKQDLPLNHKSRLLSLSPFLDKNNLIRVGGRIDASNCPYEKKHPIVLDASHHLTKIYFEREHIRQLHAGPQLLLATVRYTIWPINGRRLARNTVHACVKCRRFQGKTLCPKMGDLPAQRVTPDFPFLSVGLDFAGPFFIINRKGRGARLIKCYLCLFICMRYKCVHLEAVSSLSKEEFVMTLRRFISRRGKPLEIFSDNGRNFVAAAKELSSFLKINNHSLSDFAAQEGIKFSFIPAYSPHFGGIWESGIKSAKHHITRVMSNNNLTFEEIQTLFAQVEAILNSRPLCPMSSNPNDFLFLSPGHFIIGRPLTSLPTHALEDVNPNILNRYQRLEQARQHFWRRWQREYISELQQRQKWTKPAASLNVGDLVLIKEDHVAPLCWSLGRVTKLYMGPDATCRVADVQTIKGCIRRPLVRLCPLPKLTDNLC